MQAFAHMVVMVGSSDVPWLDGTRPDLTPSPPVGVLLPKTWVSDLAIRIWPRAAQ
jgi:hypothetical protein